MKRFLVFSGDIYYPSGGIEDFQRDTDSLEEAVALVNPPAEYRWGHVWDSETRQIVFATQDGILFDEARLSETNKELPCR